MKFTSKRELVESIESEHQAFLDLASSIPRKRYRDEGVWGDGWTIQDLLAHLTEWEQMFLRWYREGREGGSPALPAPGYKWNQTPALNRAIQRKHCRKSLKRVLEEFDASYDEIVTLARELTPKQLLTPGVFAWTGKNPLATYLTPNTCSHYRTAGKILKRWLKGQRRSQPGRAPMIHFECTGVGWQHYLSSGWGRCRRFIEVLEDRKAGRQIDFYRSGCILKYNRSHERDEYGQLIGLGFSKKDKWRDHFDNVRVLTKSEFDATWDRTTTVVR